jgi:hypothetical protein
VKSLLSSTPAIPCLVRDEFLFNGIRGHNKYSHALIVGFNAIPHRAPTFVVLLKTGAKFDPVPLHGLCSKPCAYLPLTELAWWDCFSSEHSIEVIETLRHMACEVRTRAGRTLRGQYVFTVKWSGGFADVPAEHKTHDLIALDQGNFAMMPNNKTRWLDESFVTDVCPRYVRNTRTWSCEP